MMKRWIALAACILFPTLGWAQQLAFPTAEGWGRFASGGRGDGTTGYVCHVDTLSAGTAGNQIAGTPHHRGTYQYCITRVGARTVVFDVAGRIDTGEIIMAISNGNMTMAGQTAPGEGVDIRQMWHSFRSNNHIARYMRWRPGPVADQTSWKAVDTEGDNMIFDHLSVTFSPDDSAGVWTGSNDITYQWSLIAQGLPPSAIGAFSKSCLVGGAGSSRVTYHHNFHANHDERGCYWQVGEGQQVNDVFYNFIDFTGGMINQGGVIKVEFVKNYMMTGPSSFGPYSTGHMHYGCTWTGLPQHCDDETSWYVEGNFHNILRPDNTYPERAMVRPGAGDDYIQVFTPWPTYPVLPSETDAQQARIDVLAKAGARVPFFSGVDQGQVNDMINGTGQVHKTITLASYDTIPFVERAADYDTDWDGIPNTWETLCGTTLGISPSDTNDGNNIHASGYSNLELYINALAGDYGTDGVETCAQLLAQGDTTPPNVAITAPTSNPTYATSIDPITTLAGTADDAVGVDSVTWSNAATAGSGSATGCAGETSCSWSIASIALAEGENVITVTATDAALNEGTDIITVTLDVLVFPPLPTSPGTTHPGTITFPPLVSNPGTAHSGIIGFPLLPTSPGTTHPGTITFPPPPTNPGVP